MGNLFELRVGSDRWRRPTSSPSNEKRISFYLTATLPATRRVLQLGNRSLPSVSSSTDPSFRRAMVYVFVGTRGGYNRARIVELLKEEPMNVHRISESHKFDYKTVQH